MENRFRDMESILRDLYLSVKEDGVVLTQNIVYSYLIRRNVLKCDWDKNVNGVTFNEKGEYQKGEILDTDFFSRWIYQFQFMKNIQVFCDSNWRYFCQFVNGNGVGLLSNNDVDFVKMYIPLDYPHLYQGVIRIFEFLARENICHFSKVSSDIRFDDVVVRLPSLKDAIKLQEFIDHDSFLQEGLMKGNAFAFQNHGICYAMDGRLSYNSYLSSLISNYVNEMVRNREITLQDVDVFSFREYLKDVMSDFQKLEFCLGSLRNNFQDPKENIADAYGIIRLLSLAIQSNDMNQFQEHYRYFNNKMGRKDLLMAIAEKRRMGEMDSKEELFQEFILTTMKKYPLGHDVRNTQMSGFQYIYSYLNGCNDSVTRDHDLRNRMKNQLTLEDVFEIIEKSDIFGKDWSEKVTNYIKKVILNDIITSMNQKMPHCMIQNMERFMETNQLSLITNSVGNARLLAMSFNGSAIHDFLNELGMENLNEYINTYYKEKNNNYGKGIKL